MCGREGAFRSYTDLQSRKKIDKEKLGGKDWRVGK